jgi:hypothetical protein
MLREFPKLKPKLAGSQLQLEVPRPAKRTPMLNNRNLASSIGISGINSPVLLIEYQVWAAAGNPKKVSDHSHCKAPINNNQ